MPGACEAPWRACIFPAIYLWLPAFGYGAWNKWRVQYSQGCLVCQIIMGSQQTDCEVEIFMQEFEKCSQKKCLKGKQRNGNGQQARNCTAAQFWCSLQFSDNPTLRAGMMLWVDPHQTFVFLCRHLDIGLIPGRCRTMSKGTLFGWGGFLKRVMAVRRLWSVFLVHEGLSVSVLKEVSKRHIA